MAYKMEQYIGVDLSGIVIPEDKQARLKELFDGREFNAVEFYQDLVDTSNNFKEENEEALEFDELLYAVVTAYGPKEEIQVAPEAVVEPDVVIIPTQEELLLRVREELETLNDIIADKDLFDTMSDEQKILIQDQLETLNDILND